MSLIETVIEGTLRPDGTLELDEKPNLAPGRVTVVLRQEPQPATPQEGWWPYMQRIRAEREAAGFPSPAFPSKCCQDELIETSPLGPRLSRRWLKAIQTRNSAVREGLP